MTVVRPIAAFVSGISIGLVENLISSPGDQIKSGFIPEPPMGMKDSTGGAVPVSFVDKLSAGMKYGFVSVWGDIVFWFFAGLLLAGIITVYLPEGLSEMVLGGGLVSMLAMLLIGMPIYICATASTPVAAALLLKGASPGAVLVFLLAGPATNMTSLSVLIQLLGKMGTMRYLAGIAIVSVLFGLGVDGLYDFLDVEPRAIIAEVRELLPYWAKLSTTVIVLLLSAGHAYAWLGQKWLKNKSKATFVAGFPDLRPTVHQQTMPQHVKVKSFPVGKDH